MGLMFFLDIGHIINKSIIFAKSYSRYVTFKFKRHEKSDCH